MFLFHLQWINHAMIKVFFFFFSELWEWIGGIRKAAVSQQLQPWMVTAPEMGRRPASRFRPTLKVALSPYSMDPQRNPWHTPPVRESRQCWMAGIRVNWSSFCGETRGRRIMRCGRIYGSSCVTRNIRIRQRIFIKKLSRTCLVMQVIIIELYLISFWTNINMKFW